MGAGVFNFLKLNGYNSKSIIFKKAFVVITNNVIIIVIKYIKKKLFIERELYKFLKILLSKMYFSNTYKSFEFF